MQVPSILYRADQIISAVHHSGWNVPYLLQVVHDPTIMVKPSTVDKVMAACRKQLDTCGLVEGTLLYERTLRSQSINSLYDILNEAV